MDDWLNENIWWSGTEFLKGEEDDYDNGVYLTCGDITDEIRWLKEHAKDQEQKIINLKKQVEILEKSNKYYADEEKYHVDCEIGKYSSIVCDIDDNTYIAGKRARQVQQELKELREGSDE